MTAPAAAISVLGLLGFGLVLWWCLRAMARLMDPHDWD
jgi:hypothetical protein